MQKPSLKELHFCHSRHFLPFLIPRNKFAVPGEMSAGEFKYLVLHLVDFSHRLNLSPRGSPKGPSDAEVQKEIKKATPEDGPGGSGWSITMDVFAKFACYRPYRPFGFCFFLSMFDLRTPSGADYLHFYEWSCAATCHH